MTQPLLLMAVAGFSLGGAIAFYRQGRPLWATLVLIVLAFALLLIGALAARQ